MLCLPGVATRVWARRRLGLGLRRARDRLLDVGRVVAVVAGDQRVFARLGQHLELVRQRAADVAGVRLDGAEREAAAREDALVGLVHLLVFALRVLDVDVERIRVLHDELAPAHQAGARPQLVAELGLDLIEVQRQLAPAPDLAAHQRRDHLLVRRADDEVAALAILEAQQLIAVVLPAPGLLPQLARDDRGQEHLRGARAIHLLADDALDLLHDAPAERQERVDAGRDLAQVTAAHHEDVRGDLRLGRRFLQRGDQGLRLTHVG